MERTLRILMTTFWGLVGTAFAVLVIGGGARIAPAQAADRAVQRDAAARFLEARCRMALEGGDGSSTSALLDCVSSGTPENVRETEPMNRD